MKSLDNLLNHPTTAHLIGDVNTETIARRGFTPKNINIFASKYTQIQDCPHYSFPCHQEAVRLLPDIIDNPVQRLVQADKKTDFKFPDYVGRDYQTLNLRTMAALEGQSFEELQEEHRADYQQLFDRVSLELADSALDSLPTDERLRAYQAGDGDVDREGDAHVLKSTLGDPDHGEGRVVDA